MKKRENIEMEQKPQYGLMNQKLKFGTGLLRGSVVTRKIWGLKIECLSTIRLPLPSVDLPGSRQAGAEGRWNS
jgi:hypothetical protein